MILSYLNPVKSYQTLKESFNDLTKFKKYKKIVFSLQEEGKLEQIGLRLDNDANLYLGINLNPELLLYSETSQESVELKMVSDKMTKYTDFLTKEGIIDSVKVDYERVQSEEYYGYVLRISYAFTKYTTKSKIIYGISYFLLIILSLVGLVILIK
jgi:hypothetical protein